MSTIKTFVSRGDDCIDVVVGYDFSPGRPGRHTMPNGDPGYPDDPAELDIYSVVDADTKAELELTVEEADELQERVEVLAWQQHQKELAKMMGDFFADKDYQ